MRGAFPEHEFFDELLYSSKANPISDILAVIDGDQLERFRQYVRDNRELESDDQLISINSAPAWGVEEIRKFLFYFDSE